MLTKLKIFGPITAVLLVSAWTISQPGFAQMGNMPMNKEAPKTALKSSSGTGTVTAVNAANKKITVDHGPMPEIEWPAMKMEFPVAPSVDLSKVKVGNKVKFTLTGSGMVYTVQSITRQ